MMAVILAGGKGTRLAPYNTIFPKPLVPLGERPILDIIIQQLAYYGFDRIVLSVGYLAELIEAYFQSGSPRVNNAQIRFIREKKPLGTVGSLALIPDLSESFLVMNGDVLTSLDYAKFFKFHQEHGGQLTVALNRRQVKLDLGVAEINEQFELQSFLEKPTLNYRVSMGVYVYEREVLNYIPAGGYLDFPEVVWQMLRDGKKIVGYPSDDYWLDLGSHVDYKKAQDEFNAMRGRLLPK
ncbi:MAG: sugar phosphate nucleotidyltransferase [Candidatus Binatia bacterium]